MSDQHKSKNQKLVLIAGILAIGLLATSLAGSQLMNARAQTGNNDSRIVTSIDDIDCSKQYSSVHCVDGPVTRPDSGTGTASSNDSQVVTSNDNVTCSESPSLVHCVDNASKVTVSTSGVATTKVQPDKFTVTVGVETNGTTAEEAASANANASAKIVAAFQDFGIADKELSTNYYNVYPIYDYKPMNKMCIDVYPPPPDCQPKQNIVGYKASNSLSVTLDASGDVDAGKVIDTAISAGANNVNGMYFFLSPEKQQEVRDSLIKDAIANARHRADVAAEALSMHVSGVQTVSLNDVYFPIPYTPYLAKTAAEGADIGTQILPSEQEVTATLSIIYYMAAIQTGNDNAGNSSGEADVSANAVAIARQFLLQKLPTLGIQISNELDLHTDMVVAETESDYIVEFSVMDQNGQSHDGRVQISNGEVTTAMMDDKSIL